MNATEASSPPGAAPGSNRKRNPVLGCLQAMALIMVIMAAGAFALYYLGQDGLRRFSESFLSERIEESFLAETQRIASTNGNILEVATHESIEEFRRESVATMMGWQLPGTGSNVVMRVPATYRFHIKLDGSWNLWTEGGTVIVVAPAVEATLPVAFDTSKMDVSSAGGIFSPLRNRSNMEVLHGRLTPKLEARAQSQDMKESVREVCRHSLGMFVKNWLLSEDQWKPEQFTEIKVMFPDEQTLDPASMPATISLQEEFPAQASQ